MRYLGIEVDDAIEIVEKTDIGTSWAGSSGPARHADAMPHIPDVVGGTLYVAD